MCFLYEKYLLNLYLVGENEDFLVKESNQNWKTILDINISIGSTSHGFEPVCGYLTTTVS